MSVSQGGDLTPTNGGAQHVPAMPEEMDFLAAARSLPAAEIAALWAVRKDMLEFKRMEQVEENRLAYYAAKAAMQGEMPIVPRTKPNSNTGKNYSPLEEVVRVCAPCWSKFGFSVGFDVITLENGWLQVICHIDHARGHRETFTNPPAPPDDRGIKGNVNKTLVQGNQATVTYAKRGVLCNALGIVTEDEDDDGNSGQSGNGGEDTRHTRQTGSREHEHRPPPWRATTTRKLDDTTTYPQWLSTLNECLGTCPSMTELTAFKKALWPLIKDKVKDSPKEREVADAFKLAAELLSPAKEQASDKKSDKESDELARPTKADGSPLSDDELWVEDRISELALCDKYTFLIMSKSKPIETYMVALGKRAPELAVKVDEAFDQAARRLGMLQ